MMLSSINKMEWWFYLCQFNDTECLLTRVARAHKHREVIAYPGGLPGYRTAFPLLRTRAGPPGHGSRVRMRGNEFALRRMRTEGRRFKPGKEEAEWTSAYVSVLSKSYSMQSTCFANKTISSWPGMTARQRRRPTSGSPRMLIVSPRIWNMRTFNTPVSISEPGGVGHPAHAQIRGKPHIPGVFCARSPSAPGETFLLNQVWYRFASTAEKADHPDPSEHNDPRHPGGSSEIPRTLTDWESILNAARFRNFLVKKKQ